MEFLELRDLSGVEDSLRVDENGLELVELFHFQEEQEVVLEQSAVAGVHMDALLVSNLGKVIVGDTLQDHTQVAEDVVVVGSKVKSLEVHDGSRLILALLVKDVS